MLKGRAIVILILVIAVIVLIAVFLPSASEAPAVGDNPNQPTEPVISESGNMKIYWPQPNATVTRPLVVFGEARVFENTVSYRLLNADGGLLVNGFTTAYAPDIGQFGPFSIPLWYDEQPVGTEGFVEVFTHSAQDGSAVDLVRIPVKLSTEEVSAVKVYFGNGNADPNVMLCDRTFAVVRTVPKTLGIARAAIDEMLKGPSDFEKDLGYFTSIDAMSGVKIQSLVIENGVAKIDFNVALETNAGGSCRVLAIRSQIENTLRQFETVEDVIISIDGRVEDILQP